MEADTVLVTVEIPKGSRNKYEFDEELGLFKLDRMLFSSVHYPTEYGFIREAWGEDGDPLDALVITGEPTFTGCVIEARPIGLFQMTDQKGLDSKILCVPCKDPQWNWMNELADVPKMLPQEIENFFSIYTELEGKKAEVEGWYRREEALAVIAAAQRGSPSGKRAADRTAPLCGPAPGGRITGSSCSLYRCVSWPGHTAPHRTAPDTAQPFRG